jgi:phage terminase large subunit-like protein
MKYFALLSLLAMPCFGQLSTGKAETKGACSPAITGSHNTIKIDVKNCGMSKEQTNELRSLFEQILKKQVDPKVLMAVLDDIKSGLIRIENGVVRIEGKVSEIQEGQKPRALNIQQQAQLAFAMSGVEPQSIRFDVRPGDDEVLSLENSVNAALFRVGIKLVDDGNMMFNGTPYPPPGIAIVYSGDRATTAMALSKALASVGISNQAVLRNGTPGFLKILFGPKPTGPAGR